MSFGGFHGSWPRKPGTKGKPPVVMVPQNSPQGPPKKGQPSQGNVITVSQNPPQGPGQPRVQKPPPAPAPPPYTPEIYTEGQIKNSVAVVGRFRKWSWGQHPDEAYLADAIQACGVRVVKVDQDGSGEGAAQAEWVLFTSQPASYGKLDRWKGQRKTILWTLDWLPDFPDRGQIIDAGRGADVFVSSDQYDWAEKQGIKNHFYLPGACESFYPPFDPKPHRKCAFLGSLYNGRRKEIAAVVRSLGGEVLEKQKQWVYGPALARYVQGTKVIVGDNYRNDVPGYWSSRNYVITGAGGFLLTPQVPGIEKEFVAGKHVVLFSSLDHLKEAIESCAQYDTEREEVRKAGFHHTRIHHNWAVRARALLEKIGILSVKH